MTEKMIPAKLLIVAGVFLGALIFISISGVKMQKALAGKNGQRLIHKPAAKCFQQHNLKEANEYLNRVFSDQD